MSRQSNYLTRNIEGSVRSLNEIVIVRRVDMGGSQIYQFYMWTRGGCVNVTSPQKFTHSLPEGADMPAGGNV
ncbi:hypothetical protein AGMMS50218_07160 [Actinomycetota bacterium]|nr:hypothetical protein AGMMS50218_07160 [Actinomycetota bacterium]